MPQIDAQLGFATETTVGTAVTVSKFAEYTTETIDFKYARIDSEPLRAGQHGEREDRWTPYADEVSGTISFDVLTKNFAFFLVHMLGTVQTSSVTDSVYTHTGTVGSLSGDSFTAQVNRPFYVTGDQAFTLAGTKIKRWTLANTVPGNLTCELEVDAMSYSTATALASASYPTLMDPLTFKGASVTIASTSYDVTEFSVSMDNQLKTSDRRYFGNTRKEQLVMGQRRPEFACKVDYTSLTDFNRVASATRAGALASVVATWTGPILAGTSTYPTVTVTIPSARFDAASFAPNGYEPTEMELTGVGLDPVSGSSITIAVGSTEATP